LINFEIQHEKYVGLRLDKFLVSNISGFSRSKIQNNIRLGKVLVNGNKCKTGYLLDIDDKIDFEEIIEKQTENKLIPQKINLNIEFEDSQIIILNKPAGLVVHPGAGIDRGTLANGLKYHFNKLSQTNGVLRPGIVHRLDADTSGVMIIAKTNEAHQFLANQFQKRQVEKEYTAITWGKWNPKFGVIDKPIARKKKDPTSFYVCEKGKASSTKFKHKRDLNHFSLVSFFPKTGRTHQIRVHSKYLGYPIFGDKKYGGDKARAYGFISELKKIYCKLLDDFKGHALHANKISFIHPGTKKQVNFEIKLPKRFVHLINSISTIYER
jgi:23S rRNA pseudouridine1911/1915/1917 synthase